jgi:hypothetical protein
MVGGVVGLSRQRGSKFIAPWPEGNALTGS